MRVNRIELVHAADEPVALADVGRGGGRGLDRDFDRILQVALRDLADHRGMVAENSAT
jgi:hypothetical protein